MKIKFDTNTLDYDLASDAWRFLMHDAGPDDLTLQVCTWNTRHFNLSGEVNSKHSPLLEKLFDNENWNEEVDKL